MAVAFDASSKSGVAVSSGNGSWTHTPSGTPRGILLFLLDDSGSTDLFTGATYDGTAMTAVSGGFAQDTAGEPGCCKAYFLGSSISTGAKTVAVTTTSTAWWGVAISFTASANTEVYTSGIVLLQGDGTLAEQSVTDGSPGTNSLRAAGLFTGLASPPAAGANSTVTQSLDDGPLGFSVVVENTAGQGSRSVGWSSGSTDDRAAVHLAVREVSGGGGGGTGGVIGGRVLIPSLAG